MQIAIENLGKVAPTVEKGYWDSNKAYDRLVIVRPSSISYKTYISRKPVPAGTPLSNKEYWIPFSSLQESYENWANTLQELLNQYYSTMQNAISFKGDIEVIPAGETRDVGFTFDCINAEGTVMLDIYKDGVQVAHHNATTFPYHFIISNGGTGLYRCEADVNGIKYVGLWDIKESYDFWIGTGTDYNAVIANPSYKHVGASSLSGTYFLNPNENDYIFIICKSNVVPTSVTMSSFEIPFNFEIAETITVEGVEYSVYQSINTYQQGSIEIKVNDIQYDTDSYIAHLIEEVLALKTKAEGTEEEVRTIADEETITVTENNKVALKNRPMKKSATTDEVIQKGYVILRETDDFKTIVESYTDGHVIFEIDYAFDLDGQSVNIPEGCTLKFEGGSIKNGSVVFNGTELAGSPKFAVSGVSGQIVNDVVNIDWFCEDGYISGIMYQLSLCCQGHNIAFSRKNYYTNDKTTIDGRVNLIGNGASIYLLLNENTSYVVGNITYHKGIVFGDKLTYTGTIEDLDIIVGDNGEDINAYILDPVHLGGIDGIVFRNCTFSQIGHFANSFITSKENGNYTTLHTFNSKGYLIEHCSFMFRKLANLRGVYESVYDSVEAIGFDRNFDIVVCDCYVHLMTDDLCAHDCKNIKFYNNLIEAFDGRLAATNSEDVYIYNNVLAYIDEEGIGMGIQVSREDATSKRYDNKNVHIFGNVVDYTNSKNSASYGIRVWGDGVYIHDNTLVPHYDEVNDKYISAQIAIEYKSNIITDNVYIYNNKCNQMLVSSSLAGKNIVIKGNIFKDYGSSPAAYFDGNTIEGFINYGNESNRPDLTGRTSTVPLKPYRYFDTGLGVNVFWNGTTTKNSWFTAGGENVTGITALKGSSNLRNGLTLTSDNEGFRFYDNTLKMYLMWNGTKWVNDEGVDMTGVTRIRGTKAQADTMAEGLTTANAGLRYYATDSSLKKYILWNGSAWTNLDGTALS